VSKAAFDKIADGLREAIEYAKADTTSPLAEEGIRKDDPFAKASPRPWPEPHYDEWFEEFVIGDDNIVSETAQLRITQSTLIARFPSEEDARLAWAAVNAFNPERDQQIRELVKAARSACSYIETQACWDKWPCAAWYYDLKKSLIALPEDK